MQDIIIYENGDVEIKTVIEKDNIWLTQSELVILFDKDQSVISRHINNIFKDKEVDEKSNMQKMHIANSDKPVNQYSLDIILAVGYRTNSSKAIKFRQWATNILKQYLLNGYVLNQKKLQQEKLEELDKTIKLIKQGFENENLSIKEAKGFLEIVSNYAKTWALLQGYDEQSLEDLTQTTDSKFILDYDEVNEAIKELKRVLISKGEATELFGAQKAGEFKGHLLNIYQTFGGVELLASVEEKAVNLLYYVIKGHPFNDGNKRIGAYLFILFLDKNKILSEYSVKPPPLGGGYKR